MVIASAGHTASHSLHAMQRSSPLGYRRSACSPRKRGLIGVFSSGNCTVIFRANRCRPVSIRPLTSSTSRKVLKSPFIRSCPPPYPERRLHPRAKHDNPGDGEGQEHLPAEPHDLVVAIVRE